MCQAALLLLLLTDASVNDDAARADVDSDYSSVQAVEVRTVAQTRVLVASKETTEPSLPTSQERELLVKELQGRIADLIKEVGDDDGEWVADRARLEMQLATARLELAAAELIESKKENDFNKRKEAVMKSLRLVQHADRTLDRVNIERLDDFDRRSYRGLSAMRHRVSSLQVHALLGMVGEGGPPVPGTPPPRPSTPQSNPPPQPGNCVTERHCRDSSACCRFFRRIFRR
jgi:hypothetical protein